MTGTNGVGIAAIVLTGIGIVGLAPAFGEAGGRVADPPIVQVLVEELPGDRWRVVYETPDSVRALVFARSGRLPRDDWKVLGTGGGHDACRIGIHEGRDALFPCGERFRRAILEIPSNDDDLPKEYTLNPPFSDESRLFFLGHLVVSRPGDPETPMHRFELRTRSGRWVVTPGRRGRGTVVWMVPAAELDYAAYAYFGPSPPVEGRSMLLVPDPGLPAWLADEARELLPSVFDVFRDRLGFHLTSKPMVLLSFGGFESPGTTFRGGVLSGQIQIDVRGEALEEPDEETVRHLLVKIAHEGFHLWNGGRFRTHEEVSDEWLSEGAADYFAARALVEMGRLTESDLERSALEAANECILGLEGRPLLSALEPGWYDYANHYTCGLALHWVAGRIAGRTEGGFDDSWDLYGALFRQADALTDRYTGLDFVDLLRRERPEAAIPVLRLLAAGGAVGAVWSDLFGLAGSEVVAVTPWQAPLDHGAERRLLIRFLGSCLCGDARSFEWTAEGLRSTGAECGAWKGEEIRAVEGSAVRREPRAAYRLAWERHRGEEPIRLETTDGTTVSGRCGPGDHRPFGDLIAPAP